MNLSTLSLAILTVLGVTSFCAFPVSGHGRLWEPPGRSTMWRRGFSTPINYNDNQLYCGGFAHQVSLGYKCGVCGDPFDGARLHEAGGLYATGTIARTYRQGQRVVFTVDLTANHKGFFEFRICPTDSPSIKATKGCLDQNLLTLDNTVETKRLIDFIGPAMVNVSVRLPASLTCDFCVVQWRYHAGNNWGTDPDGRSCLGCGHQEEFYGCADIRILPDGGSTGGGQSSSSTQASSSTTAASTTSTTTTTTTTTHEPTATVTTSTETPSQSTTSAASTFSTARSTSGQRTSESTTTSTTTTTTTPSPGGQTCRSHSGNPGLNQWCATNCARNFCPRQMCTCNGGQRLSCVGIGAFSNNNAISRWCLLNCGMGFCPVNMCSCQYVPY